MTVEKLKYEESMIDKYVKLFYPKTSKYKKPVLDGVTDVEKYLKNSRKNKKICWILKEPYDDKDGYGGGFDLRKLLPSRYIKKAHNFSPTWNIVGMISYSILNGFKPYNEIIELERTKYMLSLLQISFINIGKMPSKTGSETKDKDLWKHYEHWKPILNWQLSKYNPDIIIFGNTDKYFWDDLGLDDGDCKKNKNGNYVLKDGKIYITVWHPSQTKIKHEAYFNGIINAVKKGENYIGKKSVI
jgi:hypothetical protein